MEDSIFFSTRLKSKREKKRIIITAKQKEIIQKFQRRKEIYQEQKNIPIVPLTQPYQKGYERYFVMKDGIRNEKELAFFSSILEKINTIQYAENKKFTTKKKRNEKRIYTPRIQKLKQLQPYEFAGPHSILNDNERQYFVCVETFDPVTNRFKGLYEFLQPWRFRLIIKPNMITHYKPLIAELKQEEAEVDQFLDNHKNQGILFKITNKGYSYPMKPKIKNEFKKRKFFNMKNTALEIAEMLTEFEPQVSRRML